MSAHLRSGYDVGKPLIAHAPCSERSATIGGVVFGNGHGAAAAVSAGRVAAAAVAPMVRSSLEAFPGRGAQQQRHPDPGGGLAGESRCVPGSGSRSPAAAAPDPGALLSLAGVGLSVADPASGGTRLEGDAARSGLCRQERTDAGKRLSGSGVSDAKASRSQGSASHPPGQPAGDGVLSGFGHGLRHGRAAPGPWDVIAGGMAGGDPPDPGLGLE